MGKIVLLLLFAIVVYWWLRTQRLTAKRGGTKRTTDPETMVSCTYCGLHVPLKESVSSDGRYYCGEEHRRLDATGRSD